MSGALILVHILCDPETSFSGVFTRKKKIRLRTKHYLKSYAHKIGNHINVKKHFRESDWLYVQNVVLCMIKIVYSTNNMGSDEMLSKNIRI